MADLSVYDRLKTLSDYQKENADASMKRQLMQSEISKSKMLDVDKLGEVGFMKAAMGQPLTPQEEAAARFVDAKSGGIMFNPATGAIQQKPRISEKIGLPGGGYAPQDQAYSTLPPQLPAVFNMDQGSQPVNEFDLRYQEQLNNARGNPKLQQSIREAHAKEKMQFDEAQAKAAGFTDRTRSAEAVFTDPSIIEAGMSPMQRMGAVTPFIGNYLVSNEYQQFDQAQRDFINAVLRRESGAVINPEEFTNARLQYLPQPGDSEAVLAQKKANRANAIAGLQTSAGAAYKAPSLYERSEADFNSKKNKGGWGYGGKVD